MRNKILIFSLLITTLSFSQTNYYVKNGGSDAANGLSDGTAWETIVKVNSSTFLPGDSILFNKGDEWNETLSIPSSGTAESYITFSSYGTGFKPKIHGSKSVTSFSAHATLSNVYVLNDTMALNPNDYNDRTFHGSIWYILEDSVAWGDGILDYQTSLSALTTNYYWTWQNDSVYFYYDGNISDIDTIECTQLDAGIFTLEEYITIDGFELKYFGDRCIGSGIYPEYTVYGCNIRNNHLAYTSSKEEVGYGVELFYCDMIIEKNEIHSQGRRMIGVHTFDQAQSVTVRNVYIQDNECYDGWHNFGCGIGNNGNDNTYRNIHIRRNNFHEGNIVKFTPSNGIGIINNSNDVEDLDSVYIYNNLINGFTGSGIFVQHPNNLSIVNNTVIAANWTTTNFVYTTGSDVNLTIINNIFFNGYHESTSLDGIRGASDYSTTLDTSDYNIYYENDLNNLMYDDLLGLPNVRYSGFSQIQDSLQELHTQTPPTLAYFVDSLSDFHVKEGSPAIAMGTPNWLTPTDIEGNIRSLTTPTIGAYEYDGIIPPIPPTPPISGTIYLKCRNGSYLISRIGPRLNQRK